MQRRAIIDSETDARMRAAFGKVSRILDLCLMDNLHLGNRLRSLQSALDTFEDLMLDERRPAAPRRAGRSSRTRTSYFTINLVKIALPPLLACIFRALLDRAGSNSSNGSGGWAPIDSLLESVEMELHGTPNRHSVVNAIYRLRQKFSLAGLDASYIEQSDSKGYRLRTEKLRIGRPDIPSDR